MDSICRAASTLRKVPILFNPEPDIIRESAGRIQASSHKRTKPIPAVARLIAAISPEPPSPKTAILPLAKFFRASFWSKPNS